MVFFAFLNKQIVKNKNSRRSPDESFLDHLESFWKFWIFSFEGVPFKTFRWRDSERHCEKTIKTFSFKLKKSEIKRKLICKSVKITNLPGIKKILTATSRVFGYLLSFKISQTINFFCQKFSNTNELHSLRNFEYFKRQVLAEQENYGLDCFFPLEKMKKITTFQNEFLKRVSLLIKISVN